MTLIQEDIRERRAVFESVREYRQRGRLPNLNGKNPAVGGMGWQDREHGDEEFAGGTNVGVTLANGLVDIDLDSPEARYADQYILPATKAIWDSKMAN